MRSRILVCSLVWTVLGAAACAPRLEAQVGGVEPASPPPPRSSEPAPAQADVELSQPDLATFVPPIGPAATVPFQGGKTELAWPALAALLAPGAPQPAVIQASRAVPVATVLRAVAAAGAREVRLQSLDGEGVMRVVALKPAPDPATRAGSDRPCHVVAMLQADGAIQLWSPAGPRSLVEGAGGVRPAEQLSRLLAAEGAHCPLRWVAFGAALPDAPFGPLFDVMSGTARAKAAPGARYVLAAPPVVERER